MPPRDLLAEDDRLLDQRQETLRVWEPTTPFVVLGRTCRLEDTVYPDACAADAIPILRRSTGGGTVLQAPGCLNFTYILNLQARPRLQNVAQSYNMILQWVIDELALPGLTIAGTDLLHNGRKVSGNAQRRANGWLLHHGTLLYAMDLTLVTRYLREPPRQPPHRAGRNHAAFLTNLPPLRAKTESRDPDVTNVRTPASAPILQRLCSSPAALSNRRSYPIPTDETYRPQ